MITWPKPANQPEQEAAHLVPNPSLGQGSQGPKGLQQVVWPLLLRGLALLPHLLYPLCPQGLMFEPDWAEGGQVGGG